MNIISMSSSKDEPGAGEDPGILICGPGGGNHLHRDICIKICRGGGGGGQGGPPGSAPELELPRARAAAAECLRPYNM